MSRLMREPSDETRGVTWRITPTSRVWKFWGSTTAPV